jgi:phosphatidylglycerol---prolipoprotein diacylglyceryl transferase
VNPAVISLAFDPVLKLTDTSSVRLETLVLAGVLLAGIALAAWIGRRTPAVGPYVPAPGLRPDDLIFIVVGAVPGAIVGGRLGYVLAHLDYYSGHAAAIVDPAQGGYDLTLAVPFGILTGAMIARLVGAPVARWMHAAALPILFVLAAGKLAGVLGANGQGSPSTLPWATSYLGPGPWDALAPQLASHPAQVYEAIAGVLAMLGLWAVSRVEFVARRDGAALFAAVGMWAVGRFVVAFTWRDPVTVGPLRAEQVLALLLVAICAAGLVERARAPLLGLEEQQRRWEGEDGEGDDDEFEEIDIDREHRDQPAAPKALGPGTAAAPEPDPTAASEPPPATIDPAPPDATEPEPTEPEGPESTAPESTAPVLIESDASAPAPAAAAEESAAPVTETEQIGAFDLPDAAEPGTGR